MKYSILIIAILFILPLQTDSRSVWKDRNIYASGTNFNVGDILIVDVTDISQLKFSVTLNNDNSYNVTSNPDTGLTGFLPKVAANKKITSSDKADFSGKGNLNISIASRVVNRTRDGKFTITGAREYSFNGKINRFTLSGIVDPVLIKGRSVLSKDIADFRLEIRGLLERGVVNMERPALKEKETSSTNLTEEEKQKIIIDYINKMLREIGR
jgi:flagellar basal body L-ring protein FlgH